MLVSRYTTQPFDNVAYVSMLSECFRLGGDCRSVWGALAYATQGGVIALNKATAGYESAWEPSAKKWLIGVDWCRTEPVALEALIGMNGSEVRVHDGKTLVGRNGCVPVLPFHPKVLSIKGPQLNGAICGSGNMSRNGFTKGHEVGHLLMVVEPQNAEEFAARTELRRLERWFNSLWKAATPAEDVLEHYRTRHSDALATAAPTEDDVAGLDSLQRRIGTRRLTGADLLKMRTASHLWIEAGKLHANRGPGRPGNQLMMSPMTRVFFGCAADDVPTDTLLAHVAIRYGSYEEDGYSLRFSNNSMDVLSLPIPGSHGPTAYDSKVLMFRRLPGSTLHRFELQVGVGLADAQKRSQRAGAAFKMTSGRQWGIF